MEPKASGANPHIQDDDAVFELFFLSIVRKLFQRYELNMTPIQLSSEPTPPIENDADFYESVLRERSPLTGELPAPRYSLMPNAPPPSHRDEKPPEAVSLARRAWPFAAAAILLLVLIAVLSIGNTTSADAPQKDASQTPKALHPSDN